MFGKKKERNSTPMRIARTNYSMRFGKSATACMKKQHKSLRA